MIKFSKRLTLIISIILFGVGLKYLYYSSIFGNNQYQIAGVFVALGASIFGIYIHIFNIEHKQSEKYLDFSLN